MEARDREASLLSIRVIPFRPYILASGIGCLTFSSMSRPAEVKRKQSQGLAGGLKTIVEYPLRLLSKLKGGGRHSLPFFFPLALCHFRKLE